MSPQILSSFLLLASMVGRSVQVCAPDCTGVDPGTFVKDPTDCTRYYVCLETSGDTIINTDPLECPDGEWFNVAHTVPRCDPISTAPDGYCDGLCNPCVIDCRLDNPGTIQPDVSNCTKYHVCLDGGHTLQEECPVGAPFYDFQTGYCQTDDTLCYNYCDPCLPHCTTDGEYVADPLDCHKFYVCSPPSTALFLCPSGGVYDPEAKLCGDFPCNTVCPEIPSSSTTATPTTATPTTATPTTARPTTAIPTTAIPTSARTTTDSPTCASC